MEGLSESSSPKFVKPGLLINRRVLRIGAIRRGPKWLWVFELCAVRIVGNSPKISVLVAEFVALMRSKMAGA